MLVCFKLFLELLKQYLMVQIIECLCKIDKKHSLILILVKCSQLSSDFTYVYLSAQLRHKTSLTLVNLVIDSIFFQLSKNYFFCQLDECWYNRDDPAIVHIRGLVPIVLSQEEKSRTVQGEANMTTWLDDMHKCIYYKILSILQVFRAKTKVTLPIVRQLSKFFRNS